MPVMTCNRLESRYLYLLGLRNRYMESVTHTHTHPHTHLSFSPPPASDFHSTGLCEAEIPSHAYGCQTRNRSSDVNDMRMMIIIMIKVT